MRSSIYLSFLLLLFSIELYAQFIGIGSATPLSRLHVNGTSWFQGNNTPLAPAAGSGVAIGYTTGATGGHIFAFNYSNFTPRDLWLNNTGGGVLVNSTLTSPPGRFYVDGAGIRAISATTNSGEAVYGYASAGNAITGESENNLGIYGINHNGGGGVFGSGGYVGVQGILTGSDANRQAVRGEINTSSAGGYAGIFVNGTTAVFGTLTKTAGAFLIDHPVDPENKFLMHSFVESPDMKNIYDGTITTDANGEATVQLPDWFQALNVDFRYQLTCIGQFAQAIILKEITNNKFSIKTDHPSVKVSWQVTGIRNDPYAKEKRIPVEQLKAPDEKGKYIYPQGYGKSTDHLLDILKPMQLDKTALPVAKPIK